MTRTKTSRMLHHRRGELPMRRSGTFRKSSRGIEAICDCLLRRERTEIGIGHDDGRSVATMAMAGENGMDVRALNSITICRRAEPTVWAWEPDYLGSRETGA
jgi:hypothetical protein